MEAIIFIVIAAVVILWINARDAAKNDQDGSL